MNPFLHFTPISAALILEHTPPAWLIFLAVALAMAVCVFSFARFVENARSLWMIPSPRLLFFCLLAWCLFMPGTRKVIRTRSRPRFVVLLDTSSSMNAAPAENMATRRDMALDSLTEPWTRVVEAQADIDLYPFSSGIGSQRDLDGIDNLAAEGDSTLLRESLAAITRRYAGLDVAGLLLLSDGLDTREMDDTWANAADIPFPLYSLLLEPDDPDLWQAEPDLRVDTIDTPKRVTRGWKSELKALVSGHGTGGDPIEVTLYRDDAIYLRQTIRIPSEGGSREATFELDHPDTGIFNYTILANPLPGESNTNDNSYTVSVQVITDRNHLLYVEGSPRWESRYLTRVLRQNSQMTPLVFLRGTEGRFMTIGERGSMTPEMQPSQLSFFKIVILGDLDAQELGESRARNLVRYVEDGGSLILLGGSKAWSGSGFLASPLQALIPLKAHGNQMMEGEFSATLTDTGLAHPAFAGDRGFWESLPPILSILPGVTLSAGASSLVETRTPSGPSPVIVVQRYGQGRVAAVLSDSLWHWQLGSQVRKNKPYRRFWDQLIAWMTPREEDIEEDSLELFIDREQLYIGDEIEINARPGGIQPESRAIRCEITGPDRRTLPFEMTRRQEHDENTDGNPRSQAWHSTTFKAVQPGLHTAIAVMLIDGERKESSPLSFFVKPYTPETIPGPSNRGLLERLAGRSGGRFFENIEALQDGLSRLDIESREEELLEYHTYWQHGLVLFGLMALLITEWVTRKLKNMP